MAVEKDSLEELRKTLGRFTCGKPVQRGEKETGCQGKVPATFEWLSDTKKRGSESKNGLASSRGEKDKGQGKGGTVNLRPGTGTTGGASDGRAEGGGCDRARLGTSVCQGGGKTEREASIIQPSNLETGRSAHEACVGGGVGRKEKTRNRAHVRIGGLMRKEGNRGCSQKGGGRCPWTWSRKKNTPKTGRKIFSCELSTGRKTGKVERFLGGTMIPEVHPGEGHILNRIEGP